MANSLFPGFVLVHYTVQSRPHRAVLPCLPSLVGGSYLFEQKGGVTIFGLQHVIDEWGDVFSKQFNQTDFSFTDAELWTLDSPTADPVFRESVLPVETTTSSATTTSYSETVYTFRTSAGGILKQYAMETNFSVNVVAPAPGYNGSSQSVAFADYLLSDNDFVVGRDGTFPVTGIRKLTKTSDALRKKYLLGF